MSTRVTALRRHVRLFFRVHLALLVLALVVPGVAQANGTCSHRQQPPVAMSMSPDCHGEQRAEKADAGQHDKAKKQPGCCDVGMSCSKLYVLAPLAAEPAKTSVRLPHFAGPRAGLGSLTLLPDYPPPRA